MGGPRRPSPPSTPLAFFAAIDSPDRLPLIRLPAPSPRSRGEGTSDTALVVPSPRSYGGPKDGQRHAALPRQVRVRGGRKGRTPPSSVMPGSTRHPAARCPSRGETSSSACRWVLSARRRSPAGCRIRSGMTEAAHPLLPLPHRGGDRPVAGIPCTADLRARGERRAGFTLPLRGRVGPQVRGGVIRDVVTPTRAFRATSPLKGEVGGPRRGSSLCPAAAKLIRSAPAPCRRGHGSPASPPACSAARCRHRKPSLRRGS
ncbi:hypothetical protein DFR48_11573 [Ciceribacter lividus]|uniref:Uncharacterized protein n=1 Tax=Ciceribacter lividus TaxID=1197950 RepID=A0A6I7HJL8_9HYPH|nr:hypothetical protein DFR48_11573 [Ciceribacter lividus]